MYYMGILITVDRCVGGCRYICIKICVKGHACEWICKHVDMDVGNRIRLACDKT